MATDDGIFHENTSYGEAADVPTDLTTNACFKSSSSKYFSARIQSLSETWSDFESELDFDIESSKCHWTELNSDDEDEQPPNSVVFEELKEHPEWGPFFRRLPLEVKIGAKIGEGVQAEIFEAFARNDYNENKSVVLKVFKKGTPVIYTSSWTKRCCKAMELQPFSSQETHTLLMQIAHSMVILHNLGLLHNDLKAANILIAHESGIRITDFNSSVGIAGTGFWRAPEILLALKTRTLKPKTLTQQTDVYSFAMTCYEVIMGCIPFEGHPFSNYDLVLSGGRPTMPDDTHVALKTLLRKCWHHEPDQRPSFVEIVEDSLRKLAM